MGNKEVVKRNTNNRRQTWWGQLTTISENDSQSVSIKYFFLTFSYVKNCTILFW